MLFIIDKNKIDMDTMYLIGKNMGLIQNKDESTDEFAFRTYLTFSFDGEDDYLDIDINTLINYSDKNWAYIKEYAKWPDNGEII